MKMGSWIRVKIAKKMPPESHVSFLLPPWSTQARGHQYRKTNRARSREHEDVGSRNVPKHANEMLPEAGKPASKPARKPANQQTTIECQKAWSYDAGGKGRSP